MRIGKIVFVGFLLFVRNEAVFSDSWPQFRGLAGDAVSNEKNLPTHWSEKEGILWVTELPGRANSSPAVTSNRIDLTLQTEDRSLWILSIDRKTGKFLHELRVGSGTLAAKGSAKLYAHRHNAATPSPMADEKHVWAFFGSGLLVCVDMESGKVVWKKDMVREYGQYDITFGMGSSPRIWRDLLYVNCITKGPSYVVAFEKMTGKEIWRTDRELPAKDDGPDAYSTPTILQTNGREELLISGSDHVNAYDLLTGKQLWISAGLTIGSPYGRIIASATAAEGVVIATSANPPGGGIGHVIAVEGNGKGDVTNSLRLWKYPKSTPDSSTPVCYAGNVYMISDNGIASALDLRTGAVHWFDRIGEGPFHASVVAGDGKVFFLSINGQCTVIEAGTRKKILATNDLPGTFYATPAISDGTIYLRAYERLYAISGR